MATLSRASTAVASIDPDDPQINEKDSTVLSLWQEAFDGLTDEDQESLDFAGSEARPSWSTVHAAILQKQDECAKKQWVLYTNKDGEEVMVREVFNRMSGWINRFKEVGDVAVQYNPSHAALPWAAVRFFLEIWVNDCQTFGSMLESIEKVSSVVARYTELETRVLIRTSVLTKQLSTALVKLYAAILRFLVQARHYYAKRTIKRILKSSFQSVKSVVDQPILRIEQYETDVYKLVCLVQDECANISLAEIIASIKQGFMNSHISNEDRRRRLSAWINGMDTKNTFESALQYHHDGTCEWALHLKDLQAWASPQPIQGKLLWIHGPAGFGKTVLSAWIIQHLVKEIQGSVSYFFCVAENEAARDPYAILRSWLSQLLEQDQAVLPLLDAIFTTRTSKDQALTHLELWQLFVTVGESIPGTTFVVDGFDECTHINSGAQYHTKDPRGYFLRDLILHLSKTRSRVLLVSRDVPDIKEYLSKDIADSSTIEKYEYEITAKDTSADVSLFSKSMVEARLPKKNASLRENIAKQAAERSEGMFLWIKLLENEISPGQNAKELRKTVLEMPSGISEAYSRELEKIAQLPARHKEKALTILRWVLFAVRPLQVKELAEALIVSDDDNELEEYPEEDLPDTWTDCFVDEDYVKEMILGRCGSLLQLRSTSEPQSLANNTVHFVHFSLKEYLFSLTLTNSLAGALGLADAEAEQTRLSKICLRYLALGVFAEIPLNTDIYPFLSYAAWAWYFHGFHQKPSPSKDIMDWTQKVFDPTTSIWRVWSPVLEAELDNSEDEEWDFEMVTNSSQNDVISEIDDEILSVPEEAEAEKAALFQTTVENPVYYASLLGLQEVVKWLEDQGLDCSCAGGRFGFPLQAAVVGNHECVVTYLLNRNVNVSQKGGQYGAAIIAASAVSTPEIVQILLNADADVNATDETGWTALHHASNRGSARIVEQLLDQDIDMNAVTKFGSTPISLAYANGNKDVLSVLLVKGADLELANEDGETPLQVALANGHQDLACNLIDRGVSIDTHLSNGLTPLLLAVTNNHLQVVKKLIEKNVNLNHIFKNNFTALKQAVGKADPSIVKALLDAGADVTYAGQYGATPLHVAAMKNRPEIIKMLLAHGSAVDQTSISNLTALFLAVRQNSNAAMELLLERGASLQCIYEESQETLFDTAIELGHLDVAEALVKHGCFRPLRPMSATPRQPAAVIDDSGSNLTMMSFAGDAEGVKTLLRKRPSMINEDDLSEALHIAAARGFADLVRTLVQHGVQVNRKDMNGRTAMHHAALHTHQDVADILIDHGAHFSVEDDIGSTPVDLAVKNGQISLKFIKRHLSDLAFHIKRRPSLLDSTDGKVGAATATKIRKALWGNWEGYYEYLSWMEGRKDHYSLKFPDTTPDGVPGCTFSSEDNADIWGDFQFHGFVDEKGTVWFVKLYSKTGWLYRGQLDPDLKTMRGTWGGNRKLWFGTFNMTRTDSIDPHDEDGSES